MLTKVMPLGKKELAKQFNSIYNIKILPRGLRVKVCLQIQMG